MTKKIWPVFSRWLTPALDIREANVELPDECQIFSAKGSSQDSSPSRTPPHANDGSRDESWESNVISGPERNRILTEDKSSSGQNHHQNYYIYPNYNYNIEEKQREGQKSGSTFNWQQKIKGGKIKQDNATINKAGIAFLSVSSLKLVYVKSIEHKHF